MTNEGGAKLTSAAAFSSSVISFFLPLPLPLTSPSPPSPSAPSSALTFALPLPLTSLLVVVDEEEAVAAEGDFPSRRACWSASERAVNDSTAARLICYMYTRMQEFQVSLRAFGKIPTDGEHRRRTRHRKKRRKKTGKRKTVQRTSCRSFLRFSNRAANSVTHFPSSSTSQNQSCNPAGTVPFSVEVGRSEAASRP